MQQRSLLGWALAIAFSASVSCSSDSSSGLPQGFGLACKADKDCASYDLFCGAAATCVQCKDSSDCNPADQCSAGLCKAQVKCSDSSACSGDEVCDVNFHRCVECVNNKDCKQGLICRQSSCVDQATCQFTSNCTGGLWCDMTQHLCVTCRNDDDCGLREVCTDNDCLPLVASGGKGSGGASGTGGKATGGTETGGTATGGTSAGGKATGGIGGSAVGGSAVGGFGGVSGSGTGGDSGSAGLAGEAGAAGAGGASGCDCVGGDVCTPDLRCVPPTLIDDLLDCDAQILEIQGRKGSWLAEADSGINLMHGYSNPGATWADHTCAAWATGGSAVGAINVSYADIFFNINDGLSYNLSGYAGLQVKLESDGDVNVILGTSTAAYFSYKLIAITPGSNLRTVPFVSMTKTGTPSLTDIRTVEFAPAVPSNFGFAVHKVSLY